MSSSGWEALENLTHDVFDLQSRLVDARSGRAHRLARELENQIKVADERRTKLLADIIANLDDTPAPVPDPEEIDEAGEAEPPLEPVHPIIESSTESVEGDIIMWDQLTNDIERAQNEINVDRAEMLARHAEELKGLDAKQTVLDTLKPAIDAFMQTFNRPSPDGTVTLREGHEWVDEWVQQPARA
jgi:hypothetical protein